jgi:hypothetical protein
MFFAALVACCAFCSAATQAQVVNLPVAPLQSIDRSPTAAMLFDTGGWLTTRSIQGAFGHLAATINQSVTLQLRYPIHFHSRAEFFLTGKSTNY